MKLGEKEAREGGRYCSTFRLEGPVPFLSSGNTPCVTVQVLCEEKKGSPFLPSRVNTELTAELILIVYSLELKSGTPNICELQSFLS